MIYQESDCVRIARRENNKKRNYLVVNCLQGKHVPVSPQKSLDMFFALADQLKEPFSSEKLLVIGFAETATAVGAAVAVRLQALYMQTTREHMEGAEYFYFSEEHSHASEQKLVKNDLDRVIGRIDRILFVEDELTTGNTILNLIRILEKEYPGQVSYAAASLLNGMKEESLKCYRERQIPLYYLVKTDHEAYSRQAEQYAKEGVYKVCTQEKVCASHADSQSDVDTDACVVSDRGIKEAGGGEPVYFKELHIKGRMDARRMVDAAEYERACMSLLGETERMLQQELSGRVLVLGTEEFMYPAMLAAAGIAAKGADVYFHATTRSPVLVYQEPRYPLHERYELMSLYDSGRRTFLYDIGAYDTVLIITDAKDSGPEGICSLVQAVSRTNRRIYFVRWCG